MFLSVNDAEHLYELRCGMLHSFMGYGTKPNGTVVSVFELTEEYASQMVTKVAYKTPIGIPPKDINTYTISVSKMADALTTAIQTYKSKLSSDKDLKDNFTQLHDEGHVLYVKPYNKTILVVS